MVALVVAALAGPAHADKAAADAAFAEAKRLIAAGKVREACPKLEVSFQEDPQLGTLLNLAACHEQIGKLATAWAEFRAAIELARSRKDNREKFARERAAKLDDRISHLVIRAKPGIRGLTIHLDGRDITALVGIEIPIDPGPHTITTTAPGRPSSRSTITIEDEGSSHELTVPGRTTEPAEEPEDAEPSPVEDPEARPAPRGRGRRIATVASGAAGVVATGIGLYFGRRAFADWTDSREFCDPDRRCDARGRALIDDANRAATMSNVFVGVGLGAIAVSVVLWLTAPSDHRPAERAGARVGVIPLVAPGAGGATVLLRF